MTKVKDLLSRTGDATEAKIKEILFSKAIKTATQIIESRKEEVEDIENEIEKNKIRLASSNYEDIGSKINKLFDLEQLLAVKYKKLYTARETYNKYFVE